MLTKFEYMYKIGRYIGRNKNQRKNKLYKNIKGRNENWSEEDCFAVSFISTTQTLYIMRASCTPHGKRSTYETTHENGST